MSRNPTEPIPWQLPGSSSGGYAVHGASGPNWLSLSRIRSSMQAKLIVGGAGASIIALSLIAAVAFFVTKDAISDTVMNGLNAVATTQHQQINSLFAHYQDEVDSISTDTHVTQSLRHYIATGDHVDRLVLNQILTDRASKSGSEESFDLHNTTGQIVASSDPSHIGESATDPTIEGFIIDSASNGLSSSLPGIRVSGPIIFDGRTVGYVTVHHDLVDLSYIVTRYIGRRDTGESVIVQRAEDGDAWFVTGLRFNNGGDFYRPIEENPDRVEIRALSQGAGRETDLTDYRGATVYSVHQYIEIADIGLIVKIDESEALSRVGGLTRALTLAIIGVSIVIVITTIFISRRLVSPISQLTQAADKFSRGELSSRVYLESTDEIGTLGLTFNNMASSLQSANETLETKVDERTADLKRSNQDLEQFAYVASHDLQEPLRMVSSYTQLLSKRYTGKLDSDADEFISFAVDGAKRMQTLINDLLTYSRAGRSDGILKKVDTSWIVDQALNHLESRIETAGGTVDVGELPDVVADRQQLMSVFQNLISNSIKYRSANRDVHVEISAERIANAWQFSVKDNGIGIDSTFSDRIFTIFQRLHGREEYQGTGIGLAVVKKIVERSGGTIRMESELGEGSVFIFTVIDRVSDEESSQDDERNDLRVAS
jgi:signal transduction histidine kinase